MDIPFDYLARWGHFLAGITWIGLLYYFNFVQGAYFKEAQAESRVDAITKLVPRALWWFRWAAMFTFLTGLVLLYYKRSLINIDITLGATMGILMFLNVWLIIWPNQKIVIASNEQIQSGGEALAGATAAAPKAALASRINTLFSFPMLFFMGSSFHMPHSSAGNRALIVGLVIIALIELNGIFGKQGPITTVKGVITSGLVLTAILWGVVAYV